MAPAATIAGTLSPAGEPLQRLPPADARPCTCLEPIRLIASSTPGQTLPKLLWSCSAMPETAAPMRKPPSAVCSICGHLGDFLDVDDHAGLQHAWTHLHQKIGAAGQDARGAAGFRKCADRFVKRSPAPDIGVPSWSSAISLLSARPIWATALSRPGSAASLHGGRRLEQPVEIGLIRQAPMRAAGLARPDCSEASEP